MSNQQVLGDDAERFAVRSGDGAPIVDVVIPVFNEARVLARNVSALHSYLDQRFPWSWRITIVDNGSTDDTRQVAEALAERLVDVVVLALEIKGRGHALRAAWSRSDAVVVAYMDVDLSTGLDALLPLVAPLLSGHSDLAVGSRLAAGSSVARGPRRELISRVYNAMLRVVFANRFRDAQCGFKAVRTDVARRLLPMVEDNGWFFDTELLLIAEHNGLRVHEVPVDWVDDADSRVHVARTAREDLRGAARVLRTFAGGGGTVELGPLQRPVLGFDMGRQLVSFGLIGSVSTAVSLALFLLLRDATGEVEANIVAVASTALGNAWANRRFTFGHRARVDRRRHVCVSAAAFVVTMVLSSAVLAWTMRLDFGLLSRVFSLVAVWVSIASVRFALLRAWVFRKSEP